MGGGAAVWRVFYHVHIIISQLYTGSTRVRATARLRVKEVCTGSNEVSWLCVGAGDMELLGDNEGVGGGLLVSGNGMDS